MYKNKKFNLAIIFILLILVSCDKNTNKNFEFVNTIYLKDCDTLISMNTNTIGSIVNIQCYDSILIMRNSFNDQFFSFFNTNSEKILGHWGNVGNGPLEYVEISSEFSIIDNNIIFREIAKKEIVKIDLNDILHFFENRNHKVNEIKSSYLYSRNFRPLRAEFVADKMICTGCFDEGNLKVIDSNNNIITLSKDYPFESGNISNLYKGRIFQSLLKSNCQQNKIARSYIASDILEIYDISKNENQLIYMNDYKHPPILSSKKQNPNIDETKSIGGIVGIDATEDLLFLSWSSKTFNELSDIGYRFNEIVCLNWSGKILRKYVLPFDVDNFCVTNKHIYAIDEQEDTISIYRFKINNKLETTAEI